MLPTPRAGQLKRREGADGRNPIRVLRSVALITWPLLLITFWFMVRAADAGPIELLVGSARELSRSAWAPALLLGLYLLRPLLLVPITALNVASGLVLGPALGLVLALAGTLISASSGYGIGRLLGSAELAENLASRWRFVRVLEERSFEAVVGGGLMYLHADMVNLPAGMLRIRYPLFLLGIAVGNSLTMTMSVLAGAALEDSISEARVTVDLWYISAAVALFLVSLLLARALRARLRPVERG